MPCPFRHRRAEQRRRSSAGARPFPRRWALRFCSFVEDALWNRFHGMFLTKRGLSQSPPIADLSVNLSTSHATILGAEPLDTAAQETWIVRKLFMCFRIRRDP